MSEDLRRRARRLTWLLRHGAGEVGLAMDAAGFVSVPDALAASGLSEAELAQVVASDNKSRFERRGDQIRAAQGHSLERTPVTLEGLEASWTPWTGDGPLWHGTTAEAAGIIEVEGIHPMGRSHVHLALRPDSRVGKRAGVEVLLGVSPARLAAAGRTIWLSANGVALVRDVPPGCIVERVIAKRSARVT